MQTVVAVLPGRADDLARLQTLVAGQEPVVTVIGKYNHGKSRLLNELIGLDAFAVADRRETTTLSRRVRQGVCWLDAPGLDADVGAGDDQQAMQAVWLESDIRLFVHAAKEGELDARELALLGQLRADSDRTRRQAVFVLSQVDQVADEAMLQNVQQTIAAQAPGMVLHAVSSARHRKGVAEGKALFLEKSGIPALRAELGKALAHVPLAREHEHALLHSEIAEELRQLLAAQVAALAALRQTQHRQGQDFAQGLKAIIDKVGGDIAAMLDTLDAQGADAASVPDTAKDAYALTAGKVERAHIQMGYSRACIAIDAFLAGHGVTGLPSAQQTAARSLNSVMVAVMGVSVKFRKDLRRMFCEATGRARMHGEFTRYYAISADRQALVRQIESAEAAVEASGKAAAALDALRVCP